MTDRPHHEKESYPDSGSTSQHDATQPPVQVEIIIIHSTELLREGLRHLLLESGFNAIWCGEEAPDATAIADASPSLLLIGTGHDKFHRQVTAVLEAFPEIRVVLLGDADTFSPAKLAEALRCGVDTIVPRTTSLDTLVTTLRLVLGGSAVFPKELLHILGLALPADCPAPAPLAPDLAALCLDADDCHTPPADLDRDPALPAGDAPRLEAFRLSDREVGVLMCLRKGLPNKEIARRLAIAEATVKVHVKAILRKVQMRNRTQVASWASRYDLGYQPPIDAAALHLSAADGSGCAE